MRAFTLFLLLGGAVAAQKKPVTLDALDQLANASAPSPGTPVWAPDGKRFAFRQGTALLLFDPATQRSQHVLELQILDDAARTLLKADRFDWENRRVREAPLQWFPSGKAMLYQTGGDLFVIHINEGVSDGKSAKWEQVTKTTAAERDPKISPNGRFVAFRRDWDLYVRDLTSEAETRLTSGGSETLRNGGLDWVYPEELDLGTAYWWSPDSAIAYLQFDVSNEPIFPHEDLLGRRAVYEPERYPQAGENNPDVHLGVVAATGGATKWLDVGDTRSAFLIARAGWFPDAKNVYVARETRVQNSLDLFSIDVKSGARSVILHESDTYWLNVPSDPHFLADGKQFLWLSERDGFRHIYLSSLQGRDVKQLTKGPWEVTRITGVDEESKRVSYESTEASPLERQLYSVRFDGSDKRRISTGAGTHNISMGANFYVDTYSNLKSPPRATVHTRDGKEIGVYREANRRSADQYDLRPVEIVKFPASDGTLLYGRLIKPSDFDPAKKYPAIVTVYGGPGAQSVRDMWTDLNVDQVYAHDGFVLWQIDNRGSSGRGHAFETPLFHNLGPTELADQKAGVDHLVSLGFVDPQRIGIHGWSYGGFMTLNMLLNAPDLFRAGIAGAPVTNWINYDSIYTERYMGLPADNANGYKNTSLVPKAPNLKAKLMIAHNIEDDNVLFQNTMQMIDALERAGKKFELMLYPQKTHGVTGSVSRQMDASMLDFFERTLK